jgi:autotransporter-associated beta strand protein
MDPNSASASPTVLIGGPFTVQLPITISNIPTTGTYGIGGSTDNPSTFSGLITTAQSFTVTQVANTGTNALNITGSITTTPGLNTVKTVTFANAGNVNVSGSMSSALGTLNLTQAGTGVTTVSSRLAYTGTTTVSAGTLVVSGSLSGTLAVNANASGTLILAGTGLYSNPVNSAASLTLGSTSGGTLAMNNDGTNLGGTHSSQTFANLTLANSSTIDLGSNSTGNGNTLLFSGSTNLSNYVSLTITHWSGSVYALGSTTDTGGLTQDNLLFANNPAFGALGTAITSINIYNDSNVWIGYGMEVTDGVDTELVATASVPEPGTWAMLLAGAATLIASRQISRKRR